MSTCTDARAKTVALVFDAYGTLYDVHSVVALCERFWPGKGSALSQLWRTKQLEYTWQRSLMGCYVDFRRVTEDGLRYACNALRLELDRTQFAALMQQYLQLELFPEALAALKNLAGRKLAILSNGCPDMLQPLVRASGLEDVLDWVLSVDELKIYKPDARVYQLALDRLGVPKESIGFVSSNCWDACGAKSFGFRTYWINRARAPLDALGVAPDHSISSLSELAALTA